MELIHGIGAVPSTLHPRIAIWRPYGVVENIEGGRSYYLKNASQVSRNDFERNLAKIHPCYPASNTYIPRKGATYSLNLHPNHGVLWDQKDSGEGEKREIPSTRWTMVDELND